MLLLLTELNLHRLPRLFRILYAISKGGRYIHRHLAMGFDLICPNCLNVAASDWWDKFCNEVTRALAGFVRMGKLDKPGQHEPCYLMACLGSWEKIHQLFPNLQMWVVFSSARILLQQTTGSRKQIKENKCRFSEFGAPLNSIGSSIIQSKIFFQVKEQRQCHPPARRT